MAVVGILRDWRCVRLDVDLLERKSPVAGRKGVVGPCSLTPVPQPLLSPAASW